MTHERHTIDIQEMRDELCTKHNLYARKRPFGDEWRLYIRLDGQRFRITKGWPPREVYHETADLEEIVEIYNSL